MTPLSKIALSLVIVNLSVFAVGARVAASQGTVPMASGPVSGGGPTSSVEAGAAVVEAAAAAASCEAQAALDRMDVRVALPLLPSMANHQKANMRDHLVAVQEIVVAAASDDFAGIERAALRIGYSEEMGQMCNHMGAATPGFTEQALNFHRTADTIASAARASDRAAVMQALGATLATCTGCHATFRQRVVDASEWRALSAPAPQAGAPGR